MHSSLDYKQRSKICGKSVALWRKNRGRCEHSDKKSRSGWSGWQEYLYFSGTRMVAERKLLWVNQLGCA